MEIKSIKSAVLWISQFQKIVWILHWEQWEHRNAVLHQNNALHSSEEINSINAEITAEWNTGLATLSI